jgi:hypothetical protein
LNRFYCITFELNKGWIVMDDIARKVFNQKYLPKRIAVENTKQVGRVIDDLLARQDHGDGELFSDFDLLRQMRDEINRSLQGCAAVVKAGVLVPVGLWGLTEGFAAPDMDISLLGIGNHRFFLFHSALGLVVLRHLFNKWQQVETCSPQFIKKTCGKIVGALLGAYAVGVGVHLMIDVFQPKTVIFPFFGSLVDGTMVDDNIWLLGNSLWAFKIGRDVFSLVLADDLQNAKNYVVSKFGEKPISIDSVN